MAICDLLNWRTLIKLMPLLYLSTDPINIHKELMMVIDPIHYKQTTTFQEIINHSIDLTLYVENIHICKQSSNSPEGERSKTKKEKKRKDKKKPK